MCMWRLAPNLFVFFYFAGIQDLLDEPNPNSPANGDANAIFLRKKADYSRRIREQARNFPPSG
jgi:ubiquitin-conjugating enzyme E2 I